MSTVVNVLYPVAEDATFDLEYYLNKHIPLVTERWTPYGLLNSQVATFKEGPYSVQVVLNFESAELFQKALSEHGAEINADVINYSNKPPIILVGSVISK